MPLQLRWGICSAGLISFDFADAIVHFPAEKHKIVAVVARDIARAQAFAKEFDIPKAYDKYEALANDEEIDIIYVGALQNAHYDLCKLFLSAGKHVLCEKALTCAAWQAEELVALAKSKDLFFMEALWTRCFPLMQKVREVIASGEIGNVQFVEVHFVFDSPRERLHKEELGGGVLWDIGVYGLQFVDWILGQDGEKPQRTSAVGSLLDNGVDSSCSIIMQYSAGRFANITLSICSAAESSAVVQGSKAKIQIDAPFHVPLGMVITNRDGSTRRIEAEPLPTLKYPTKYSKSEGLVYEVQHVYECFERGQRESELVPHSLSLWMQRSIDECFRQIGRCIIPQRIC